MYLLKYYYFFVSIVDKKHFQIILQGFYSVLFRSSWIVVAIININCSLLLESQIVLNSLNFDLHKKQGILYYNDKMFSGIVETLYPDFGKKEVKKYLSGKRHGITKRWYINNQTKEIKNYQNGKAVSVHKGWWPDGQNRFEYHYKNGNQHGEQKEWFINGTLSRKNTMKNGRLNGVQMGWRENGNLQFKYIYKEGRRYGLLGQKLCILPE